MIRQIDKTGATASDVAVWTPWGKQQASRPGEKIATLRRLAKRVAGLRKEGERKLSHRRDALAEG